MKINAEFEVKDQEDIIKKVVNDISRQLIYSVEHGSSLKRDKFTNQVANLLADKLYADVSASGVVQQRLDNILDKVEKSLMDRAHKEFSQRQDKA